MDIADVVDLLKANKFDFVEYTRNKDAIFLKECPNAQSGWVSDRLTWFYTKRLLNEDFIDPFINHYNYGPFINRDQVKFLELINSLKNKNLVDTIKHKIQQMRKKYRKEYKSHNRRRKRIRELPTGKIDYNYLVVIYFSTLQTMVNNGALDECIIYRTGKIKNEIKMRNIERREKLLKFKLYNREAVEKATEFLNNNLNKFLIKELSNIIIEYIEIKENVIYI